MPPEELSAHPPIPVAHDELWFRSYLDNSAPWLNEEHLPQAPEEIGYGYHVPFHADITNRTAYEKFDSAEEMHRALEGDDRSVFVTVPGFDRLFPNTISFPHTERIDPLAYRKGLRKRVLKPLAITAGLSYLAHLMRTPFMVLLALIYGVFPLFNLALDYFRHPERQSPEELNRSMVNSALFTTWIKRAGRSHTLTIGLVTLVLLYLLQLALGLERSIEIAALVKEKVRDGEVWRMLTAGFLHGSPIHILFNGMALYSLAQITLAISRKGEMLFIFLLSVLGGSLASQFLTPNGLPSVGASGGIMGLLGFMGVFVWKFRSRLPQHLVSGVGRAFLMMTVLGIVGAKFIDNAAHAGGALTGALMALSRYKKLSLSDTTTIPLAAHVVTVTVLSATAIWLIYRFGMELI